MESVEHHDTIGKTVLSSYSGQHSMTYRFHIIMKFIFLGVLEKKIRKVKPSMIYSMLYSDVKHKRILLLYVSFIGSPNQRRCETYVNMYGQAK